VIKSAMPKYTEEYYTTGVDLHVCDTRLAHQPKLAGIKHLNRIENILARIEWRDESIFDGLLLDSQDSVIECTVSNIFARFDTVLMTPDLSQCGVAGVTRQRIIALSAVLNLTIDVTQLTLSHLLQADEVIICNSLYGAFQVHKISDTTWPQLALAKTFRNLLTND